jgi:3-oxoacyl-[acyl-carrier-protein] synthase II
MHAKKRVPMRILLTSVQGVYMGSGIGSLDDVYDTTVAYEKGVSQVDHLTPPSTDCSQGYRKVSPLFVPRLLINLAAGHISMRYGFKVYKSLSSNIMLS